MKPLRFARNFAGLITPLLLMASFEYGLDWPIGALVFFVLILCALYEFLSWYWNRYLNVDRLKKKDA